jgi:hypothetical protein
MSLDVTAGANGTTYGTTTSLGRSFQAACIGVAPDGTAAFIADKSTNKLIKVTSAGALDNIGQTTFSGFTSPCFIDVVGTNVVVTTTSGIYAIDNYNNNTVAHLLYTDVATGLFLDRDAYTIGNQVAVVDSSTPVMEVVNEVTNTSGEFRASPDATKLFFYELPAVGFDRVSAPQILSSNPAQAGVTYDYLFDGGSSLTQTMPGIVPVTVYGWSGLPVYLRVVDPPDYSGYSPYTQYPNSAQYYGNDNLVPMTDTSWGIATSTNPASWSKCMSVTPTNSAIPVTFYLKVPIGAAGDNYRIEASKFPWGANCASTSNPIAGMSSLYTAWHRVFVENDRMFRYGGILAQKTSKPNSTNQVVLRMEMVQDGGYFRTDGLNINDYVAVFDVNHPLEGPHDEMWINNIATNYTTGWVTLTLSSDCESLTGKLQYQYDPWYFDNGSNSCNFINPDDCDVQAGVGAIGKASIMFVATGGSASAAPGIVGCQRPTPGDGDFYEIDLSDTLRTFSDGFIDFVSPRPGSGAVPLLPVERFSLIAHGSGRESELFGRFSNAWFKNAQFQTSGTPDSLEILHSYLHYIGAETLYDVQLPDGGFNIQAGVTNPGFASSYVFDGDIEKHFNLITPYEDEATAHETGHQFQVNLDTSDGHDTRLAWCDFPDGGHCDPQGTGDEPYQCVMIVGVTAGSENIFCIQDLVIGEMAPDGGTNGILGLVPGSIRGAADPL